MRHDAIQGRASRKVVKWFPSYRAFGGVKVNNITSSALALTASHDLIQVLS